MNMRPRGIDWFRRSVNDPHPPDRGHIKVSQYYPPEKSWIRSEVWWFDVFSKDVERPSPDHIHFLCQKLVSSDDFYHLKVPKSVLHDAVRKGCVEVTPRSIIRLHLSARSMDRFLDIRAKGPYRLDISRFLQ